MQSSSYAVDHPQIDGRSYVVETHLDAAGIIRRVEYLAAATANYAAILAARAAVMDVELADGEAAALLSDLRPLVLNYQTAAQFAARMRARYLAASRDECARLAWWIIERINAGDVTDTQVRNAFGLTVNQYNTLKTNKLTPLHDHWAAVLAAQGE